MRKNLNIMRNKEVSKTTMRRKMTTKVVINLQKRGNDSLIWFNYSILIPNNKQRYEPTYSMGIIDRKSSRSS